MALQSNLDLRLLNGLLPVRSIFDLSLQFLILRLLISVCKQFHHLCFGRPLNQLSWILLLLNTWLSFTVHSVNMTNPVQPNSVKWKYIQIYKHLNSSVHHFLQFYSTLIPPNIPLKTFLSKAASRLAISLFYVQGYALSTDWLFSRGKSA